MRRELSAKTPENGYRIQESRIFIAVLNCEITEEAITVRHIARKYSEVL